MGWKGVALIDLTHTDSNSRMVMPPNISVRSVYANFPCIQCTRMSVWMQNNIKQFA
jgi:hypothetical protein